MRKALIKHLHSTLPKGASGSFTKRELSMQSIHTIAAQAARRARVRRVIHAGFLLMAAGLLLLMASTAGAQTFDPDLGEPNAQAIAEYRAAGAFLGLMPPPIGWNCYQQYPSDFTTFVDFVCEPDPSLLSQQEQEKRDWMIQFIQRYLENSERILRRR